MQSKTVPLSGRMIATCFLFTVFALLFLYFFVVIIPDPEPIYMEDGEVMPVYFKLLFVAVIIIVEIGILFMIIPLWARIFSGRGAMTLTKEGITDTFFLFTIMAFWTTVKIKIIPWDAVEIGEDDENISVDTKKMPPNACGRFAKLMLFTGFNYKVGKITREEIEEYRQLVLQNTNSDI